MLKFFKYIFLLSVIVSTFVSCGDDDENTEPKPTNIGVNLFDDSGNKLTGVTVYLYANLEAYEEAKRTGDYGDRIAQKIASDDNDTISLIFEDVNPARDHYILATYRDRERFVDLDNFNASYKVPSTILTINGTTLVNVNLQQAKSAISFFGLSLSESDYPVTVYLGGDSIGSIGDNKTQAPISPFEESSVSFRISTSDSWYAVSSLGCLWTGDINVGGTETFTPIELDDCNAGSINFWADASLESVLPIQITIDGVDVIGTIDQTSEMPTDCFSGKGLSVGRDPSTYTYDAVSLSSNCSWRGTFTIESGVCEIIQLSPCNE